MLLASAENEGVLNMCWSTNYLHPTPGFLLLGVRWRSLKEWFNHLSAGCGCRGLGKGEGYLWGLLGEVPECGLSGKGL